MTLTAKQQEFITVHGGHWKALFEYDAVPKKAPSQVPDAHASALWLPRKKILALFEKIPMAFLQDHEQTIERESYERDLNKAKSDYAAVVAAYKDRVASTIPSPDKKPQGESFQAIALRSALTEVENSYTRYIQQYNMLNTLYPNRVQLNDTSWTISANKKVSLTDLDFKEALLDTVSHYLEQYAAVDVKKSEISELATYLVNYLLHALIIREKIKELFDTPLDDTNIFIRKLSELTFNSSLQLISPDYKFHSLVSNLIKEIRVSIGNIVQDKIPQIDHTQVSAHLRRLLIAINDSEAVQEIARSRIIAVFQKVEGLYSRNPSKKEEFLSSVRKCGTLTSCYEFILRTANTSQLRYDGSSLVLILLRELYNDSSTRDLVFGSGKFSNPDSIKAQVAEYKRLLKFNDLTGIQGVLQSMTGINTGDTNPATSPAPSPTGSRHSGSPTAT